MQLDYSELPQLQGLYLEDSWVLKICRIGDRLVVHIDAVLTQAHPGYEAPNADEQYCYRRGEIVFELVRSLRWESDRLVRAAFDATGEPDLGSVDQFAQVDGSYVLAGDFGKISVKSEPPYFSLRT